MTTSHPIDMKTEYEELPELERKRDGEGLHPAWLLVLFLALGGIVYMLFDGAESETYFLEVDQAVSRQDELTGKIVRVKGEVESGSIVAQKGQLETTFRVASKGKTMTVHYDKAMPDTFEAGQEVVVQGRLEAGMTMKADEVIVKCPSRYEGQAPTAHEAATGKKVPAGVIQ